MRRILVGVACFLGLVICGLSFLQIIQRESVLPLSSDDIGFINFRTADVPETQLQNQLSTFAKANNLEIYQLSATTGALDISVIARGGVELPTSTPINWVNPAKHGMIYPAAEQPGLSLSGIYAIKGDQQNLKQFKGWLDQIHAVNTWENYSWITLFFAPLAYQGVALALFVCVVLLISVISAFLCNVVKLGQLEY